MILLETADLMRVVAVARELDVLELAREGEQLLEQVRAGQFYTAVLGQFKRGKSSLINALLGKAVLPTGVPPLTAVATVVRDGNPEELVAHYPDGSTATLPAERLAELIRNSPAGGGSVPEAVEIGFRHPLLRDGLCLVDTPGISSVLQENTATTKRLIPRVDVALLVIGIDPPITEDELALARQTIEQGSDLILVISKIDRIPPADRAEGEAYNRSVVDDYLDGRPIPFFAVSATHWDTVGDGPRLAATLRELAANSRKRLVDTALTRGLRRLVAHLRQEVVAREQALLEPLAVTEQRLEFIDDLRHRVAQTVTDLRALVGVETNLLTIACERRRQELVQELSAATERELLMQLAQQAQLPRHKRRQAGINAVIMLAERDAAICRRHLRSWGEPEVARITARFEKMVDDLFAGLRRADLMAELELEPETAADDFREVKHPFNRMWRWQPASSWHWLADLLLPPAWQQRLLLRQLLAYWRLLMYVNSSRAANGLVETVEASRQRLENRLEDRLRRLQERTRRAYEQAASRRQAGRAACEQRLAELRRLRDELATLAGKLAAGPR